MTTLAPNSAIKPLPLTESPSTESPSLPLVGRLRLNLSALGVDTNDPQLGERLCRLSRDNEPYDFEISAQGELIVMAPSGPISNLGEQSINATLFNWCQDHPGETFSQTVQFLLPSGARYMPDAAWITQERCDSLTAAEWRSGINGAPDFVVEVRSRTDRVDAGLAKMEEWMDAGARLGWYIDPYGERVYRYRAGQEVELLESPETISAEDVLPGFVFQIGRLVFDRYREISGESECDSSEG